MFTHIFWIYLHIKRINFQLFMHARRNVKVLSDASYNQDFSMARENKNGLGSK